VTLVTAILIGLAMAGTLGYIAQRDHRRACQRRASLLNACADILDGSRLTHSGDGFPRLTGRYRGLAVDVRLICDNMTNRRLPQLWLQVTVLERRPDVEAFAALVRPSGYEFYSLTGTFDHVIEPPPLFPEEIIMRGETSTAGRTFDRVAPAMAGILADPRVKEIAVTREGLRITSQSSEGRRGEHLLLRQAVFDNAEVPAELLEKSLAEIESLRALLGPPKKLVLVA
jgi:hypothetical protein